MEYTHPDLNKPSYPSSRVKNSEKQAGQDGASVDELDTEMKRRGSQDYMSNSDKIQDD